MDFDTPGPLVGHKAGHKVGRAVHRAVHKAAHMVDSWVVHKEIAHHSLVAGRAVSYKVG